MLNHTFTVSQIKSNPYLTSIVRNWHVRFKSKSSRKLCILNLGLVAMRFRDIVKIDLQKLSDWFKLKRILRRKAFANLSYLTLNSRQFYSERLHKWQVSPGIWTVHWTYRNRIGHLTEVLQAQLALHIINQ